MTFGKTYAFYSIARDQVGNIEASPTDPNGVITPDATTTVMLRGDLNCDGQVNFGDINPFVLALLDPANYGATFPDCDLLYGDINTDGTVNFGDINPFVTLLSGGG